MIHTYIPKGKKSLHPIYKFNSPLPNFLAQVHHFLSSITITHTTLSSYNKSKFSHTASRKDEEGKQEALMKVRDYENLSIQATYDGGTGHGYTKVEWKSTNLI